MRAVLTTLALAVLLWAAPACQPDNPAPGASKAASVAPAASRPPPASPTPAAAGTAAAPAGTPGVAAMATMPPRRVEPPATAMTAADFPAPPDRDLLTLARQLRGYGATPPSPPAPRGRQVGDETDFWTLNYPRREMVRKRFRLAAKSENAYWWVEDGLRVADTDLQSTARAAEEQVYPRVSAAFGAIPELGSGGNRGHIITARIPGVGGYVSGADPYPAAVSPYSNEVDAIYINAEVAPFGEETYLRILAHELQHAIHWHADPSEETWLNEGLSELAVTEAGYSPPGSMFRYLRRPDVSLVNWPNELGGSVGLNYGAAALFAHYLRERYAAGSGLQDLLAEQQDGIAGVDAFLESREAVAGDGQPAGFHSLFADWMVANLLDWEAGDYGYAGLDVAAEITRTQQVGDAGAMASLPQYGVDYVAITDGDGAATVHFEGAGITPLLPVDVPGGSCWWSNRGDSISSTLTRRLTAPQTDADGLERKLTFLRWYDIEEDWDYLYVAASTDGGATWDALPADGATDANPLGNSYGPGYTGAGDWQRAEVSLADYAGPETLVRFHYVTDDAIHGPGFCVRELAVSGDDGESGEWQADGFVLVNNRVRQDWIVWVIGDGPQPAVSRMSLRWDAGQQRYTGTAPVPAVGDGGRVVVAVAATAPATMQPGRYRVWATAGN